MRDVGKRHCGTFDNKHDRHTWRDEEQVLWECLGAMTQAEREAAFSAQNTVNRQTQEVQRWADAAMYRAEPMEKQINGRVEPKVYLLSMTPDPLGVIAAACKMYKGEVVRNLSTVTDEERRSFFEQIQKTHLQAPFEFVDFHFMIEGVTRAFTHQMVRQRTAVYAQESLRFAVKEDAAEAVALPPSIAHTESPRVRQDSTLYNDIEDVMRQEWDDAVSAASDSYNRLVSLGMPAEDARGLLPHSITTRLHYKTNLRNLMEHAGNRLCTQAQFEWRVVWLQIVKAIREYKTPEERCNLPSHAMSYGEDSGRRSPMQWQQEVLSDLFRPICYLTGKCEFRADFDRACSIRSRVDANHAAGRDSAEWNRDYEMDGRYDDGGSHAIIPAIHPAEWLADPRAAIS